MSGIYNIHNFCSCVVMLLAGIMIEIWYHCRSEREIHGTSL